MRNLIHVLLLSLFLALPAWADLRVTQGETVTFSLTAQTGEGTDFDLTGATFTSYLRGPDGAIVELENADHTADPDQTTNRGDFTVALSAADTLLLAPGSNKEVLTKVVQGASITYFRASILTVLPPVPVK